MLFSYPLLGVATINILNLIFKSRDKLKTKREYLIIFLYYKKGDKYERFRANKTRIKRNKR